MRDVHELKTWPLYFEAVNEGRKTFEVRKDDRPFKTGDFLFLKEWHEMREAYTNKVCMVKVLYVMRDNDFVLPGHVVMGIELISSN